MCNVVYVRVTTTQHAAHIVTRLRPSQALVVTFQTAIRWLLPLPLGVRAHHDVARLAAFSEAGVEVEFDEQNANGEQGTALTIAQQFAADVVLLASGTGFAPIKAIIEHMQFMGITRDAMLYWGGRRPHDLYLHDWVLARCAEMPHLTYVPVVSDALAEDAWSGRTGFVHQAVLQDLLALSARLETAATQHNFRFGATRAYEAIVHDRIAALREAVAAKLHELPVNDVFAQDGKVGANGRLIKDVYLMEVKKPDEVTEDWDYYRIVATIPGAEAFADPADPEWTAQPLVSADTFAELTQREQEVLTVAAPLIQTRVQLLRESRDMLGFLFVSDAELTIDDKAVAKLKVSAGDVLVRMSTPENDSEEA